MAVNTRHIDASREDVFAVLADGWSYTNWVVGASHMRAVEAGWPAVGSKLHHASGLWPAMMRDETVVDAVEVGHRLELTAKGRPLGTARIVLELDDEGTGCRVTMTEHPSSGPGKWLHSPPVEAFIKARNTEALSRLAAVVERRTEPRE